MLGAIAISDLREACGPSRSIRLPKAWELLEMNTSNVNVLVVDDEQRTREYLAGILSAKGWRVDTAGDGPAALELAERTKYDAVVLDYRMPGMDGAETCRRIRQLQPDVRGVFVTGFPTIDTVYPAIAAGAGRVLAKPVNPAELVRTLEEELAKRELDSGRAGA
jgi:CheY-like chemotaxis protein